MSSGSDRRRRPPIALLGAGMVAIALVGCEREPGTAGPGDASVGGETQRPGAVAPAADVAVGPIPGAARAQQGGANPLGDDVRTLHDGRRLFVAFNCSGCHGGRAGGGMGPSLRDQRWDYGSSDAEIFDSIAQGRANGMPAWGATLPEQEIWKLVAYIRSLRTPREPEAPG